MSHPSLSQLDHRPFPLPAGRWRYSQVWSDLAFLHWPVSARWLRTKIPLGLEIDEFEGTAWIGVVPFHLRIRHRGLPAIPRIQVFPEINVRTYVTANGRPGVWFFSLDAPSPLAIWAARRWFHLPYERSRFEVSLSGRGRSRKGDRGKSAVDPLASTAQTEDTAAIEYSSTRVSGPAASFQGRYRPIGPPAPPQPGTLDHFLTERYCLYAADPGGNLYIGNVHHVAWPLQPAESEIESNTMTAPWGLDLSAPPHHVAFARSITVATWPLERLAPPL